MNPAGAGLRAATHSGEQRSEKDVLLHDGLSPHSAPAGSRGLEAGASRLPFEETVGPPIGIHWLVATRLGE